MDVRCERCRAQYVFDDEQITPSGLTVQCTNCGHLFKVKKKELVVTVPVRPGELDQAPIPATSATPQRLGAGAAPEPGREWRLRRPDGEVITFRELSLLQRWIVERRVGRDDEIAGGPPGEEGWRRLGSLPDLAPFFQVVDAAERGRPPATEPMFPAVKPPSGARVPPPPSGFPPPSFVQPRPPPTPPTLIFPTSPEPEVFVDTTADEPLPPAKPRRSRAPAVVLTLLLLAVAGLGGVYVFAPGLLGRFGTRPPAPEALEERPQTAQREPAPPEPPVVSPDPEPAPAAPAATPTATATAPATATPTPTPTATATPTPTATAPEPATPPATEPAPAPKGPKATLAEADRLRARGDCKRALDLYGRLLVRDPEHAAALTGRGLCYLDAEEYGPAEASFQTALAVDSASADALLGLAETLRWQGRTADAIGYYEKYLAQHPDGEDAAVARNALDTLRKE
jgi:predicted Zn finger-like uncharacterized protein